MWPLREFLRCRPGPHVFSNPTLILCEPVTYDADAFATLRTLSCRWDRVVFHRVHPVAYAHRSGKLRFKLLSLVSAVAYHAGVKSASSASCAGEPVGGPPFQ